VEKEIEFHKIKEELERTRSQLYILYELNKALRTTLRLEEIIYIILTGLTAHEGLSFNRAILFLIDEENNKRIKGFMGIGPMDMREANSIWQSIEQQKMDLYDLIKTYRRIKESDVKPKFMEFVQSLIFDLDKDGMLLTKALWGKGPLHIKDEEIAKAQNDPLVQKLGLGEFLIAPLWIKDKPQGAIVVDNCVTKKTISETDVRIFNMFVEQAAGAIENSRAFEDTLIKAHTDTLTGLWNHGYFQYRLDEELLKSKAMARPLAIIMADLDDFKKFNDTYGHIHGDEALREIALTLKQGCREQDILCRYGGEEFSIIMPSTSRNEAYNLVEELRKNLSAKEILKNKFTLSIGLANYPDDGLEKETLLRKADVALYKAKREGKNRIILAF
jgi:diguanylate cyclase (GGDEF)-like protein